MVILVIQNYFFNQQHNQHTKVHLNNDMSNYPLFCVNCYCDIQYIFIPVISVMFKRPTVDVEFGVESVEFPSKEG